MKLLIAADMEGITGVTNWDQVDPNHAEYQRFRKQMTADVNAAIQGVLTAGDAEIVVADGHAYATNLLIEELDPRVRLNSGSPSPYAMVQGIAPDFNGVIFIGYHARAGTPNAILDHTWSGRAVADVWLNEVLVGEIGLNAALCGHFGVPVIMVSGDQHACKEALDLLGPVEVAVVKRAVGRTAAECLPPTIAQEKICEAAGRAMDRLQRGDVPPPYSPQTPITVTVRFTNSVLADRASMLPGAKRLDGRRVACTAADVPEVYRAFRALVSLSRD